MDINTISKPIPILTLNNLSYSYHTLSGETKALENISFHVFPGEFIAIVGPSGCGKSTLLNIIAGQITDYTGELQFQNTPLCTLQNHSKDLHIGYMLQHDHLFDWRTIYKNVCLGLEIKNLLTDEYEEYVQSLLKKYGLYDFKDKKPSQLSGGMRQRAALIRTLAVNPDILLLDEAFSALDYQTRLLVTDDVYKIIKAENKTTIMVTHDIPESISMSDEVIVLSNRPSIIKDVYKIEFDIPNRTPLSCRDNPTFTQYFDKVWRSLNSN